MNIILLHALLGLFLTWPNWAQAQVNVGVTTFHSCAVYKDTGEETATYLMCLKKSGVTDLAGLLTMILCSSGSCDSITDPPTFGPYIYIGSIAGPFKNFNELKKMHDELIKGGEEKTSLRKSLFFSGDK